MSLGKRRYQPHPQRSDSVSLGWGTGICHKVYEPHIEKYCLRKTGVGPSGLAT